MRDFTLQSYSGLLSALIESGYSGARFSDWVGEGDFPSGLSVVLRHDVDRLPWNSVRTAELEAERGLFGSYYFRIVKGAWDPAAIRRIAELGHECGYHYEDLDLAGGNVDEAIRLFEKHLQQLREIVPVKTICMHGSPMSKWDNRDIWMANGGERMADGNSVFRCCSDSVSGEADGAGSSASETIENEARTPQYRNTEKQKNRKTETVEPPKNRNTEVPPQPSPAHYRDFGIIGEPYFDVDFNEVGYITDTGRSWNNREASIRDKVETSFDFRFRSTDELCQAIRDGKIPKKLMITLHPQRWNDAWIPWTTELVGQSVKNVVKRFLVSRRSG